MSSSSCSQIAIKEETTYGTAATGTYVVTEFTGAGLVADSAVNTPVSINGSRGKRRVTASEYITGGNLDFLMSPGGMTLPLFKGLFGIGNTVDLGDGVYQHNFTAAAACGQLPSYTVYQDVLTAKFNWLGCFINTLSMSVVVRDDPTFSWGIIGQKDELTTAPTRNIVEPDPAVFSDLIIQRGGITNTNYESMTLDISNGIEGTQTLDGTRFIKGGETTEFTVTGTLTKEFDNLEEKRIFWGGVVATGPQAGLLATSLKFTVTTPEEIGSSGVYHTIEIELPNVYLMGDAIPIEPGSRLMEDIPFEATQDAGGIVATAFVKNGESAIG